MTEKQLCNFILKKAQADNGDVIKKDFNLHWISSYSYQPTAIGSDEGYINIWLYKISGESNKKTFRIKVKSIDTFISLNNEMKKILYTDLFLENDFEDLKTEDEPINTIDPFGSKEN